MLRSFSLSIGVVLLLSPGVFAAIGQAEGFSINAFNMVQRVGGAGWAESGNIVMFGHGQTAYTKGAAAMQREAGILIQGARVVGIGGETTVLQNASVSSLQGQIVSSQVPGAQALGQSLTIGLDNGVLKAGGIGGAVGAQGFVGAQSQFMATPNGTVANYQVVGAAQLATVSGSPGSNFEVNNTLDIAAGQGQIINGGTVSP